ncbi:L,D-transpeptidase/peptidoglycan binding protein [Microbacterium sp. W1N]|uniref:L,D-transpeptidase family protein n=1 Tax=Microbacterium festucae TaxID=2977531 RepID=UPI0021C22F21|nr:L,D-transpeptidase family protein [Microbacterium festucae]MCT9818862.1 L,D-transpeptidase/peptidoglycan binding protein [Microbacterium festucae]
MTDLTTKPEFGADSGDPSDAAAPVQWAEPQPKKKSRLRLALWIGIPAALVVGGAAAASLVLIAPGTTVAGVPVGWQTAGAATDAVQQSLDATTVTLGTSGPTLTAADLGATVDAEALAQAAFDQHPLWNVTAWFGEPIEAPITLDADTATAALAAAAPDLYTDPVPAAIAFDGAAYVVTPAVDGTGVDVEALQAAVTDAFAAGTTAPVIEPESAPVAAPAGTAKADGTASSLNGMLQNIGFYVGEERTVPVDAATAASWITVAPGADGEFAVSADAAKIQASVDGLAAQVDQAPVDATVITNAAGKVLRTTTDGQDGRALGDTAGIANDFAAQLASGNAVYQLPVEVTAHTTKTAAYLLEVDLSEQRVWAKSNGETVMTWPISSGLDETPTHTGRFNIGWRTPSQTMTSSKYGYRVENVAWVMYFNGDQGFHGAYWHNNFGNQMSHGCVNMPNSKAKQLYDWAPTGTDVWIHD